MFVILILKIRSPIGMKTSKQTKKKTNNSIVGLIKFFNEILRHITIFFILNKYYYQFNYQTKYESKIYIISQKFKEHECSSEWTSARRLRHCL